MNMDKLKFGLFSIVVLSLLGLSWYWSVNTIETGAEHKANAELANLQKENADLKSQVSLLTEQLAELKPATKEEETSVVEPAPTKPAATTTTTTVNKNQTLINELQKLVDDNVVMKLKSTGTRVGTVQKFLNLYNGTNTKIDNDYGATTVKLVTDFQKDQGLTANGEAGASTFKKMIEWLKKN
jgi:murein L,D-transpeptidase YcbB/YkuD